MTSIAEEDINKVVDMGESLSPNKIVGGINHATVKQGRENEFESLFRELAAKVREHDKDATTMIFTGQSNQEPIWLGSNIRIGMPCSDIRDQNMANTIFQRFVNYSKI
jgi:alpha-galactosidase/6-phospho-beta-glucosidase family protein